MKTFPIEDLRAAVKLFGNCSETFNQSFSDPLQLLAVYFAYRAAGYDFLPDEWSDRQIDEAIQGLVPMWDPNGAIYGHPNQKRVTS